MNKIKREKLVSAVRNRPRVHDDEIERLKTNAAENLNRTDWLWHLLLSSMATMGNSRGYDGLIMNDENYTLVSYASLLNLEPPKRVDNIRLALRRAKVRRPATKGRWLADNYLFIQDLGGVEIAQNILLGTKGQRSKIKLMRLFSGIGEKYARNIFMDIHHHDFVGSIAIDQRVSKILVALELPPKLPYTEGEDVLVRIANDCGITPWHLDRLLYRFTDYYIEGMNN